MSFADIVKQWTPDNVAAWLRGLDDTVLPYIHFFVNSRLNGLQLLLVTSGDLEKLGVSQIGARNTIVQCIELLRHLSNTLDTENLQSLVLGVSVKARNIWGELKRLSGNVSSSTSICGALPKDIHNAISLLADDAKRLVMWLSSPFNELQNYLLFRKAIVCVILELVAGAQEVSKGAVKTVDIQMKCSQLCTLCDNFIQNCSDSLALQTAYLDRVTIRRKIPLEELGFHIDSSYNGVHTISDVKYQSLADATKMDVGDELIQINGQVVVGWQLRKLITLLKDARSSDVVLLLKKRPREVNNYYKPTTQTPKLRKKLSKAFGPDPAMIAAAISTVESEPVVVAASVTPSAPAAVRKIRRRSSSMSVPRTPGGSQAYKVVSSQECPTPSSPTFPDIPGSDWNNNGTPDSEDDLELKPRQRCATVSGGSPTLKRLSVHLTQRNSITPRMASAWFEGGEHASVEPRRVGSRLDREAPRYRKTYMNNQVSLPPPTESFSSSSSSTEDISSPAAHAGHRLKKVSDTDADDDVFRKETVAGAAQVVKLGVESGLKDDLEWSRPLLHTQSSEEDILGGFDRNGSSVRTVIANGQTSSAIPEDFLADAPPNVTIVAHETVKVKPQYAVLKTTNSSAIAVTETESLSPTESSFYPSSVYAHVSSLGGFSTLPRATQAKLTRFFGESPRDALLKIYGGSDDEDNNGRERHRRPSSPPIQSTRHLTLVGSPPKHLLKLSPRGSTAKIDLLGTDNQEQKAAELAIERDTDTSVVLTGMRRLSSVSTPTRTPNISECNASDAASASASPLTPASTFAFGSQYSPIDRLAFGCLLPCRSLGSTEHAGWVCRARLRHERVSITRNKWPKRWLALKKTRLFVYKSPQATRAEGCIYLPLFMVSPVGTDFRSSRKHVFQIYNRDMVFYFSCEQHQDQIMWLNKLGLAAIGYGSGEQLDPPETLRPGWYFADFDHYFAQAASEDSNTLQTVASSTPMYGTVPRISGQHRSILHSTQSSSVVETLRKSLRSHGARLNRNGSSGGSSVSSKGAYSVSPAARVRRLWHGTEAFTDATRANDNLRPRSKSTSEADTNVKRSKHAVDDGDGVMTRSAVETSEIDGIVN